MATTRTANDLSKICRPGCICAIAREDAEREGTAITGIRFCFAENVEFAMLGTRRMGEQRTLSPQELTELFRRLDTLIDEARTLQRQITERLLSSRSRDLMVRTGQPGVVKSAAETRRTEKGEGPERRRKGRAK